MRRAHAAKANPVAAIALAQLFPPELTPPSGAIVAGYAPWRTEIDPGPLMARLASRGARLALPVTPPKGSDAALAFRLWNPVQILSPGHFGVREPSDDAPEVDPDLVLVPLLAFDRRGHRLGWGAGHYDRTLLALRQRKPAPAIGLAYAAQRFEDLPVQAHDQVLDGVLTEVAYIEVRKDNECA